MATPNEEYQLLKFARGVIAHELELAPEPEMPLLDLLTRRIACFVEIYGFDGGMRGCMGNLEPFETLGENIRRHVLNAAFGDPAFPPLEPEEFHEISIAVSLVSPLRQLASPDDFEPGIHGLLLCCGDRRAVFLPGLIREQRWSLAEALDALSRKAGLPPDLWRSGDAQWHVFELERMTGQRRAMQYRV